MRPVTTIGDIINHGHRLIAVCREVTCRQSCYVDLEQMTLHVAPRSEILPVKGVVHFSDRMRCPACGHRGMFIWLEPKVIAPRLSAQPNFVITDHGRNYPYNEDRAIATADNLMVGRGAYGAAASFYGTNRITLRQGAFVVADSKRDGPPRILLAEDYKAMRDAEDSLSNPRKIG